jgi:DnaK suppressor protein
MATTQKEKPDVKARLEEELQSSRADLQQIEESIIAITRDGALEGGVPTNHMADDGSDVYERERLLTIQIELEERIDLIEGALGRLESGTFGVCERCGKKIAAARLEALPFARYCIACQEVVDEEYHAEGMRSQSGR